MNTPPPPGSMDEDERPELPRRRNSLTSLDPRSAKRQRRMAVVAAPDEEDGPDSPKHLMANLSLDTPMVHADDKVYRLSALLRKHAICGNWPPDLCHKIYSEFSLEEYKRGSTIFNSHHSDDKFYVVEKGFCGVEGNMGPAAGPGCTFGDLSLLQEDNKRLAITALCDVTLWSVNGAMVRVMIVQHQSARFFTVKNFFHDHAHGLGLNTLDDLRMVEETSAAITLTLGQSLPVSDAVYIVKDGDVEETKWLSPQTLLPSVRRKQAMDCIGLEAMHGVQNIKVTCLSRTCTLLAIKIAVVEQIPALKQALVAMFYRAQRH